LRRAKVQAELPCLGCDRTIRRSIKSLEEKGLIARSKTDSSWVSITDAGKSYLFAPDKTVRTEDKLSQSRTKLSGGGGQNCPEGADKTVRRGRTKLSAYHITNNHITNDQDTNDQNTQAQQAAQQSPPAEKPKTKLTAKD